MAFKFSLILLVESGIQNYQKKLEIINQILIVIMNSLK